MPWNRLDAAVLTAPILAALHESQRTGREWKHQSHQEAKDLLKVALFSAQESQCAYCRREIKDEDGRVEIEHVLPKAPSRYVTYATSNQTRNRRQTQGYPQFMFSGQNLVLTCKRCNTKKHTYDSRTDRALVSPVVYPNDPSNFIWVHPYFHDYSEHIAIARGYVYQVANNSAAGKAVIKECKLDTLAAVETKAVERSLASLPNLEEALIKIWANPDLDEEQSANALHARFPVLDRARIQAILAVHGRGIDGLAAAAAEIRAI